MSVGGGLMISKLALSAAFKMGATLFTEGITNGLNTMFYQLASNSMNTQKLEEQGLGLSHDLGYSFLLGFDLGAGLSLLSGKAAGIYKWATKASREAPVSYTHLTLPTICSV